jgi:hypothetical protein
MEAFDQGGLSKTSHTSRSGNPEFELSLPLDSHEVSEKSKEEGALDEEEA